MYSLPLTNVDLLDTDDNNFDVVPCAWHGPGSTGKAVVTGVDTCLRKPLIATCGLDRTVRIWNYQERSVELVKQFEEEALAIAMHPSGLHVAVAFTDKVRFLNLLMDDIRPFKDFSIKGCRELRFSHGGHFLAVANGQFAVVFDFFRCAQHASLQQLNAKITSMAWSKDDRFLFSAGVGGSIFKWDVANKEKATDYVNRSFNWSSIAVNPEGTSTTRARLLPALQPPCATSPCFSQAPWSTRWAPRPLRLAPPTRPSPSTAAPGAPWWRLSSRRSGTLSTSTRSSWTPACWRARWR